MNEQFWWFLARSSGIVAWLLLTASVLWGILLATDLFPEARRPAWLLDLHRWLGGLTITFVAVHMAALFADSWIEFTVVDLAVPFAADWRPVPVGLGVLAMWTLVAVQVTSLMRRRLPRRFWRLMHLTSYVAFWLTSLHGTFSGSDRMQPLYLVTSVLSVAAVVFAMSYRILNGRHRGSGERSRSAQPGRPSDPDPEPAMLS